MSDNILVMIFRRRETITEKETLFKLLNTIRFGGLRGVLVGDALKDIVFFGDYRDILEMNAFLFLKRYAKRFIHSLFYSYTSTVQRGKGKVFFVVTRYGYRKDMIPWFERICQLCDNSIVSQPGKKELHIDDLLVGPLFFVWVIQLFLAGFSWRQSRTISIFLYFAVKEYKDIIRGINWKDINLVTVFCDQHPSDNLVVQKAIMMRVKTASLQHGVYPFADWRRWTDCDYFLGYGKHSKEAFLASNPLKRTHFVCAGYVKMLLDDVLIPESMQINHKKMGFLGILLTGDEAEDEKVLECGFSFAKKNNLKVNIRPHPSSRENEYKDEWKKRIYSVSLEVNGLHDFLKSSYIYVCGSSTAFWESVIFLVPCFHLNRKKNSCHGIEWCSFSDIDELNKLYQQFNDCPLRFEKKLLETREYFTEVHDVKGNYKRFFTQFDY